MVKQRHSQAKLWVSQKEWIAEGGGKNRNDDIAPTEKRIPFETCHLSMKEWKTPCCTRNGEHIFDYETILQYLAENGNTNPVNGWQLRSSDLFKLHVKKDDKGQCICPISRSPFTQTTHIVAIATSGHVFKYGIVDDLNIKGKMMRCLMTDTPFTKKDIIHLQLPPDSTITRSSDISASLSSKRSKQSAGPSDKIQASSTMQRIFSKMKEVEKANPKSSLENDGTASADVSSSLLKASHSLTSSVSSTNSFIPTKVDTNGYARIRTSMGDINVELFCKECPLACENFLTLASRKYYNNTRFHRLIKNFIIQGGDPKGTGLGGESMWGKPFPDEISPSLVHSKKGTLSMANSGPSSNGSQFFILLKDGSHAHLDGKHTVFGKVVGGISVIDAMNTQVKTTNDRPVSEVKLHEVVVFVDPFEQLRQIKKSEAKLKAGEVSKKRLQTATTSHSSKKTKV